MRKCIEITVQGLRLRGVVHVPSLQANSGLDGMGVVILHPGFLPRSAQSDSAVTMADTLARNGIPTVRIDLPGLGDSEGDLPEDSFTFIDQVQEGGLADIAFECVERIKSRLGWRRVIVGGHCGGAITAFFAAAARKQNWPAGIFALDVIYYLVRPIHPPVKSSNGAVVRPPRGLRREVLRNEIRLALLNSPLGGPLQKAAQRSREWIKALKPRGGTPAPLDRKPSNPESLARPVLPAEANIKLLTSVEKLLLSELPILFVTADDPTKPSDFNYTGYMLARHAGRATHSKLTGTDHGFISGDGKSRVSECVLNWILGVFPKPPVPNRDLLPNVMARS